MKAALLAAFIVFAGNQATVPASGDQQRLLGAWRFVREVDTKANGSPAPAAAMSDCEGLLVYAPDGYMAINIVPKGRKWSAGTATLDEMKETIGNGTSYVGRYEVDAAGHNVTHVVSISVDPAFQGKRLTRHYAFVGETLQLSGTFVFNGETIRFVITWERAPRTG
jgi:ribosomal protein S18 acetylase RimI-like enzyme